MRLVKFGCGPWAALWLKAFVFRMRFNAPHYAFRRFLSPVSSHWLLMLTTAIPASWACLQAETRALESAGAITIASTRWATISSTRSTWRFRSRSSLIPLTISSYSEECSPWCLRAPSAIVLKNLLASDFMIRAIRGFSDFVFEAVDAGVVPPSGTPPPHPCAEPSKTALRPQASHGKHRGEFMDCCAFMAVIALGFGEAGWKAGPGPRAHAAAVRAGVSDTSESLAKFPRSGTNRPC